MAIAPLSYEEWGINEVPSVPTVRDRSHLRVVPEGGFAVPKGPEAPSRAAMTPLQRLEARRVIRRRRQFVAGALVVLSCMVAYALPVTVLGGTPTASAQLVGNSTPGAALGIYTVQPGDTVASIAEAHASGAGVAELQQAIERAVGSGTVVPGETINLNP